MKKKICGIAIITLLAFLTVSPATAAQAKSPYMSAKEIAILDATVNTSGTSWYFECLEDPDSSRETSKAGWADSGERSDHDKKRVVSWLPLVPGSFTRYVHLAGADLPTDMGGGVYQIDVAKNPYAAPALNRSGCNLPPVIRQSGTAYGAAAMKLFAKAYDEIHANELIYPRKFKCVTSECLFQLKAAMDNLPSNIPGGLLSVHSVCAGILIIDLSKEDACARVAKFDRVLAVLQTNLQKLRADLPYTARLSTNRMIEPIVYFKSNLTPREPSQGYYESIAEGRYQFVHKYYVSPKLRDILSRQAAIMCRNVGKSLKSYEGARRRAQLGIDNPGEHVRTLSLLIKQINDNIEAAKVSPNQITLASSNPPQHRADGYITWPEGPLFAHNPNETLETLGLRLRSLKSARPDPSVYEPMKMQEFLRAYTCDGNKQPWMS